MKFTDGLWMTLPGFNIHRGMELRDYQVDEDKLILYVACTRVLRRGDTLRGPLLTITFSSPMTDVIYTEIEHYSDDEKQRYHLASDDVKISIDDREDEIYLSSGRSSVIVQKTGLFRFAFAYDGIEKTASEGLGSVSYISEGEYMAQEQNRVNDLQLSEFPVKSYIRQNLRLGVSEYIYGLGERFTPFIKNGQTVDIWQADGGTASEQSYKNIPFYVSSQNYGIFVNESEKVSFEIGSINTAKVEMSIPGEVLHYCFVGGEDLKSVLKRYTDLTGKPALPPSWSFGLWMSTSFTTSYDEETVNHFIDGLNQRDIPLSVFHYDCFWMKEYQWCDFEWDKDAFPDPEGMLKRLKEKDLRICVWINPYIGQKSPLFKEAKAAGYLLKRANGTVWQWDNWQPGMGIVDFTNPDACEWYKSKLKVLLDMGVDCFKTDFGERIPVDVIYHNGANPYTMHNFYTYFYNSAVYEVLEESKGVDNVCVFARSATVGSQKHPVHWGGDCDATYESMAETLRGGLSFGLSGFAHWSHDIGGFESTASADLYKRWIAFGLLSSHSRLHGSSTYRVPWNYDEEASDVLRFFVNLKCRLMPYIYSLAVDARITGLPLMRAMVIEFPNDRNCAQIDTQYMLGDSLLVAPVFNSQGLAEFYVPDGEGPWIDILSGKQYEAGKWHKVKMGYKQIPLLLRPGYFIPVGDVVDKPNYDYGNNLKLYGYRNGEENLNNNLSVYSDKGMLLANLKINLENNSLVVKADGDINSWTVRDLNPIVDFKLNGLLGRPFEDKNIFNLVGNEFSID